MGNRANIHVKENDSDGGVYLYTHWGAYELPEQLKSALAKNWRWNDSPYLTRIIFDVMTQDSHGEETGYGISAFLGDGDERVLEVNCKKKSVSFYGKVWTFEQFSALSESELGEVWRK